LAWADKGRERLLVLKQRCVRIGPSMGGAG
jgi:hypothetical protein